MCEFAWREYECHANVAAVAILERMNVSLMSPLSLAHVCHLWLGYEPHTDCRSEFALLGTTRQIQIEQSMPQNLVVALLVAALRKAITDR